MNYKISNKQEKDVKFNKFYSYVNSYNKSVNDALRYAYYHKTSYSVYIPANVRDQMFDDFKGEVNYGVNICKTKDLVEGDHELFKSGVYNF